MAFGLGYVLLILVKTLSSEFLGFVLAVPNSTMLSTMLEIYGSTVMNVFMFTYDCLLPGT